MTIYLDTSAAIKLVHAETHSRELGEWLQQSEHENLISSALILVETHRAVRRIEPSLASRANHVLSGIHHIAMATPILERAAAFPSADLRSLDAIHLATATYVRDEGLAAIDAFVTYDVRLATLATEHGLRTVSPGVYVQ